MNFLVFLSTTGYVWTIIILVVLAGLALGYLIPTLINTNKKLATTKNVLEEEKKKNSVECKDCKEKDERIGELLAELNNKSKDLAQLSVTNEELLASVSEVSDLKEKIKNIENENSILEEYAAGKETKINELLKDKEDADRLKAKIVENNAEIASYKATNDILSKANDNLKIQLANKDDEIEELNKKIVLLVEVEKKANEAAEDNKVLMRAVNLIMNAKDGNIPSSTIILNESKKEKPKKKSVKITEDTELESLKRPDLMHLAKKEGVQHFARKSNAEIIRLIKENRKNK